MKVHKIGEAKKHSYTQSVVGMMAVERGKGKEKGGKPITNL